MKHSRFFRLLGIALALLILFALPALALADAGNFSGGSDYGGSSGGGSWGGSSSWGSGSSSSGGYYYSSGSGTDIGALPIIIIVIVVLVIFFGKYRGNMNAAARGAGTTPFAGPSSFVRPGLLPVSKLLETDSEFSENEMKEKISNLYVKLQNAWESKKWEPMRAHMTEQLYSQFARQLEEYIQNHQTNYIDRIAVLSVVLTGVMQDEVNDTLVARVKTRIVDYVLDDRTGAVVSGSKTRELFMEYEWTLIRSRGVKTEHNDTPETVHCANCGAPLELSYSSKCDYCGAVTVNSQYDWVISSIKGISQRGA